MNSLFRASVWGFACLLAAGAAGCKNGGSSGGTRVVVEEAVCPAEPAVTPESRCLDRCAGVCVGGADCLGACEAVCTRGLFREGPARCVQACGDECVGDAACLEPCFAGCAGEPPELEYPRVPAPFLLSAPPAVTAENRAAFTFACAGFDCLGFECRLNTGAWAACTSPATFKNLANGGQVFEVRAVAGAVCAVAQAAVWQWQVAMPPPVPAPPPQSPVPPTGQKVCYDMADTMACPATGAAYHGQDAQYAEAVTQFAVNGDGTVSDAITGLMWQRQDDGATRMQTDAAAYCGALALAGHTDWRLPTNWELMSIVDYGAISPAIDAAVFPATKPSFYWTSNLSADRVEDGWVVLFSFGTVLEQLLAYEFAYTRCVRGAP